MTDTMRELARSGFVPIRGKIDENKARVLTKYNIASVVERTSSVFGGIDKARWEETKCDFALVANSQFMRMSLADDLNNRGCLKKTTIIGRLLGRGD